MKQLSNILILVILLVLTFSQFSFADETNETAKSSAANATSFDEKKKIMRARVKIAQSEADNRFASKKWHQGPYFLLGLGPSGMTSITNDSKNRSIAGGHILASIGVWTYNAFGIEVGAIINLSYFHDMTDYNFIEESNGLYRKVRVDGINSYMWDTSFYHGIMFRDPFLIPTDLINLYGKIFIGYGKSVYWVNNFPEGLLSDEIDRFYNEGALFGISIGNVFNAFNDSTVWYIQFSIFAKLYNDMIAVKDGGVLPEEISSQQNTTNMYLVQMHLTVGIRLY
ncbi:MAG: hypothetical protein GY754_44695 [bacterium]|nr:hypothetical protein [bacterium]